MKKRIAEQIEQAESHLELSRSLKPNAEVATRIQYWTGRLYGLRCALGIVNEELSAAVRQIERVLDK